MKFDVTQDGYTSATLLFAVAVHKLLVMYIFTFHTNYKTWYLITEELPILFQEREVFLAVLGDLLDFSF